jgi:hypothetical protein
LLADFANARLLTSEISTRDIKPQGVNMPPILQALGDQLSQDRNTVEKNFGYHKLRFEPQGSKACNRIPTGSPRWAHSHVANTYALGNIYCFQENLSIPEVDFDTMLYGDFL